jgi:hypothetical protein
MAEPLEALVRDLEVRLEQLERELEEVTTLSTPAAAELLDITPQALRCWARSRELGASRCGLVLVGRDGPRCRWRLEREKGPT